MWYRLDRRRKKRNTEVLGDRMRDDEPDAGPTRRPVTAAQQDSDSEDGSEAEYGSDFEIPDFTPDDENKPPPHQPGQHPMLSMPAVDESRHDP
ncbi:hypothetical protein CLAFUW4_06441 [Fulvia fulva]|uniref:Uncharacterized protein n=1 Tax=Passalora fulva TaxID=5499 RepID=A0A9Q8LGW2_PASFU|nr:uncharacterized protein CLAFUR5_06584 [Fulvia fulva]KAK4624569.1 hypothetical protein CLAFUR4_06444 [Fulvia fulva]KAK4625914.1 hypothetical protein CLAFUR0_06445 [Fulvia fulva]UJO17186.1 hypothetical protein CLAFUR5_06584 [Fulvia fulva]WPV15428.1 hypothetical protein CLAFUW4_06441 [Fulvia fulva]WPV30125.1 hypothetical protein CLAFUW7_06440 [Fulvia fulva]